MQVEHATAMVGKALLALLLFAVSAQAHDENSIGLDEDIAAGLDEVKKLMNASSKVIAETEARLVEDYTFFNESMNKYLNEGVTGNASAVEKIQNLTRKYVGDAIDKNKNINAFRCILRVRNETQQMVYNTHANFRKCSFNVYARQSDELGNVIDQVQYIKETADGLYSQLINEITACKDKECVSKSVNRATVRENNLRKVLRNYSEKATDLRTQFNQNQMDCVRTCQNGYNNCVTNCENRMKNC